MTTGLWVKFDNKDEEQQFIKRVWHLVDVQWFTNKYEANRFAEMKKDNGYKIARAESLWNRGHKYAIYFGT